MATAVLPIVLDLLVFAMTVFITLRHAMEMRKYCNRSIAEVLLRDGRSTLSDMLLIDAILVPS